jgi:hypothetical protein
MSGEQDAKKEAAANPDIAFFNRASMLWKIGHLKDIYGVEPKLVFNVIRMRKAGAKIIVGNTVSYGGVKPHPERVKFEDATSSVSRAIFCVVDGYVDGKELENLSLIDRPIGAAAFQTPPVVCITVDSRTPGIPVMGIQVRKQYVARLAH